MQTNQYSIIIFVSLIALTSVGFTKGKTVKPAKAKVCGEECASLPSDKDLSNQRSREVLRLENLITKDGLSTSNMAPADATSAPSVAAAPITTSEDGPYVETVDATDFDTIMSDIKVRDVTVEEALKKKKARKVGSKEFFNTL